MTSSTAVNSQGAVEASVSTVPAATDSASAFSVDHLSADGSGQEDDRRGDDQDKQALPPDIAGGRHAPGHAAGTADHPQLEPVR